jgi:Replication-relaxation
MTGSRYSPIRVRTRHVEWVRERLGERDRAILASVARLRLVTGRQLERLHFLDVAPASRARVRRRVLARLVAWRVLMTLERRIGGVRAGSSGLVFALDAAGAWLARLDDHGDRMRRAEPPGVAFAGHTLAVSELYVSLTEMVSTVGVEVTAFEAEPRSWWPNGLGGWLKPDAYVSLATADYADAWWVEVDRGTEHLPTIRAKLKAYLDFAQRGQVGPSGVMPRVLVSVPDERRREAVESVIRRLSDPADRLLHVSTAVETARYLVRVLRE